jgi:hypothetical protein
MPFCVSPSRPIVPVMCNLYSLTKGQAAIRDWFRARNDRPGNLPLFPGEAELNLDAYAVARVEAEMRQAI